MIDLERLLRVPFVASEGSFDISPGGTHFVSAWNITGQCEIYEMDLSGSNNSKPASIG
jgi:hypothetical protein